MRIALIFWLFCVLLGCSSAPEPAELPAAVETGGERWTWTPGAAAPPANIPAPVQELGFTASQSGVYRASSAIEVDVFTMKSPASAFEATQKWRVQPGVAGFHHGPYFVVCRSAALTPKQLSDFAGALSQSWRVN